MNDQRRDAPTDEHTLNIRAGLPILKSLYSLHINEEDYLDMAVDLLRDIKHFGTTEYLAILRVDEKGIAHLPCNIDSIDAVTSTKMGLKQFRSRVRIDENDEYHNDIYQKKLDIIGRLGVTRNWRELGLADYRNPEGYLSYQLNVDKNIITVDRKLSGKTLAVAFTGLAVDREGFPMITRKQANALAVNSARAVIIKKAFTGNQAAAALMEYIETRAARLIQAASIPEDITDNSLDEMFDAQTTFNRKTYRRPTKYSR